MTHRTITNSLSMDIIIKISGTMFIFIFFIFVSAWYITRKSYNLIPNVCIEGIFDKLYDYTKLTNLKKLQPYIIKKNGRSLPLSVKLNKNVQLIYINDLTWCVQNRSALIFANHYSLVPKNFQTMWKGVLFDVESPDISILKCLFLKGFETIDWDVILKAAEFGFTNSSNVSEIISFDILLGFPVDKDKLCKKYEFIEKISAMRKDLFRLYFTGIINDDDKLFDADEFYESISSLLHPVVESSIYYLDESKKAENMMTQIVLLRNYLYETKSDDKRGIRVDEFCCGLFEHHLVLTQIVDRIVSGIHYLIGASPEIVNVILKEIMLENVVLENESLLLISEQELEMADSLVYTKATALELLRLLAVGNEFDIFKLERDISIDGFDVLDGSLLVFNGLEFGGSDSYHVLGDSTTNMFRPTRFIRYSHRFDRYYFYVGRTLTDYQDMWNIFGIARTFVLRLCLIILIYMTAQSSERAEHQIQIEVKKCNKQQTRQFDLIYDVSLEFEWEFTDFR